PSEFPKFDLRPPCSDAEPIVFEPRPIELAGVRKTLQGLLRHERTSGLILLNANASDLMPLRRWPSERYVELAGRLLDRYPEVAIAFTGARAEATAVEALVQQVASPRCVSMAGKTTLRELLALYCLADVLVTNDSGPAHFASLTPIDVVVLFG